jgi:hypothetical protein
VGKIGSFLACKEAVREAGHEMYLMPKPTTHQAIVSLPNISIYCVALLAAGKILHFLDLGLLRPCC